jgi:histidinol dehydrogenase
VSAGLRVLRPKTRAGRRARARLVRRGRAGVDRKVLAQARRIVEQVRRGGDDALLELVRRHDRAEPRSVGDLRLDVGPRVETSALVPGFEETVQRAVEAVERFHRASAEHGRLWEDLRLEEADGTVIEERHLPLRRVGLYVPGGRFPYPSTVIMTAVPARLAGVEEIVVVTPPLAYRRSAELRSVLERLGVNEVWGVGGAQAIAALAYGTESIAPVDFIAGPGNVWVAAAKQLVAGDVGVDMEAGPSEVVVIASAGASPDLVAADLLAQAEHDPRAVAILITEDRTLARRVARAIEEQAASLPSAEVIADSLAAFGFAFVVEDLDEAHDLAEELAPEHLQLMGEGAETLAPRIRNAGAVFVGESTPTVFGDYLAGPSHVLPTAGTARFASGLSVADFVRRSHTVRFSVESAARRAGDAARLADVEGLAAHAASARLREPGS